MKTFFNILQTLIDKPEKLYPDESYIICNFECSEEQRMLMYFINSVYYKSRETKNFTFSKFDALHSILENSFLTAEHKEYILKMFSEAQKCYHGFSRLSHIWRLKRNKYIVTCDLSMNHLNAYDKNTFLLVESKSNYLFNINELINIIETSIGNSPNFFTEPLVPMNPYNKQPFTISTLYNIYFQIKKIDRVMPLLFHCWFLTNFNLHVFCLQFETIIREYAINNWTFKSPYNVLYYDTIRMLQGNSHTRKLVIDNDFPKDLLVNIFRPFLLHYMYSNYFIKGTTKYYNSKIILNYKLKKFYEFNKLFGRKIYTIRDVESNERCLHNFRFNTEHITFYDIPINLLNVTLDYDTDTDTDNSNP